MAQKRLDKVEIRITKDIPTGEIVGEMSAICWSPELKTRFGVRLPLAGVDEIINNAVDSLKDHMSEDGKHEVTEAPEAE